MLQAKEGLGDDPAVARPAGVAGSSPRLRTRGPRHLIDVDDGGVLVVQSRGSGHQARAQLSQLAHRHHRVGHRLPQPSRL